MYRISAAILLWVSVCVAAVPLGAAPAPAFDIGAPSLTELWVDPVNGADANSGSTRDSALQTVIAAWNKIPEAAGSSGWRIQLVAGDYPASTLPNYWEARHGTQAAPVILNSADGVLAAKLHGNLNIYDVEHLYLIGLDIDNAGDVLHCEKCNSLLIRKSRLRGGLRQAHETLKINQSQFVYIEDSDIGQSYENPIDFVAVQYGHIVRNRIHDGDDWCMYVKGGSAYLRIEGNRLYNCGTGGFTAGQGTGFEYMQSPWLHYEAYAIRFANNVIFRTEGAGMGVNGGYDIVLAHNTLYRVGLRSHVLEFAFGLRSCDGDANIPGGCGDRLTLGGWGTSALHTDGEPIPNRNVYVYNNLVYNPAGVQSQWQHLLVQGPRTPAGGSNIPSPALADDNLRLQGNIIWNGPADHALGLGEESGCGAQNTLCNATQLVADNRINGVQPQLAAPEEGDFRPAAGAGFESAPVSIPSLPAWEALNPAAPEGVPDLVIGQDFNGVQRGSPSAVGAFASSTSTPDPEAGLPMADAHVSGTVTNRQGKSLRRAKLALYQLNQRGKWKVVLKAAGGANGLYQFTDLAPGTYRLRCAVPGYRPVYFPGKAAIGRAADIIVLSGGVLFRDFVLKKQ